MNDSQKELVQVLREWADKIEAGTDVTVVFGAAVGCKGVDVDMILSGHRRIVDALIDQFVDGFE